MSADFTPEKEDYKILTPFKMQVLTNFPYIEADFDALTNYQLLCKIVEYLNEVIENENEVTEQITSLYNSYISLQNYVNNYFDNLDVQDEINNKLDDMAQDGTLNRLIGNYINPYLTSFNNQISNQNQYINVLSNKIDSAVNGNPLVASSTSDMTDTTKIYVNTTDGKWYYYDGDSWEIGGTYQSNVEGTYQLYTSDRFEPYYHGIVPIFNLINQTTYESGKLYSGSVGGNVSKSSHADYVCFGKVPIRAGYTYKLYKLVDGNITLYGNIAKHFCFVTDEDGIILENLSGTGSDIREIIPAHDGYLYLTLTTAPSYDYSSNMILCLKDHQPSEYKAFNIPWDYLINGNDYNDMYNAYTNLDPNIIIKYNTIPVGVNQTYTTINSAISTINNATSVNRYNIVIDDGTYYENNINLPNFVNLIGKSGIKENCIIDGSLEASASDSDMSGTSTLNMNYNNEIHNLTIIAKNMRYPIHSETNGAFTDFTQIVDNCIVNHLGNQEVIDYREEHSLPAGNPWAAPHGIGMGASSGCKVIIKNSIIKSVESAFYVHGASNFVKPYLITMEDSQLISTKLDSSIFVDNTTPTINGNTLIVKNCFLNSRYSIIESSSYSYNCIISGSEVVPVYQRPNHVNDKNGYPIFTNNTKMLVASENLTKGVFVKTSDGVHVTKCNNTTPLNEILGYVVGNANSGELAIINSKYMEPSSQTWPETPIESGINLYLGSDGKITTSTGTVKVGITQDRWYKLFM